MDEIFAAGGLQGFEDDGMGLASEYEDRGMPSFAHVSGEGSYVVLEAAVLEGVNRKYLKNCHYAFRSSHDRMCFSIWGIGLSAPANVILNRLYKIIFEPLDVSVHSRAYKGQGQIIIQP